MSLPAHLGLLFVVLLGLVLLLLVEDVTVKVSALSLKGIDDVLGLDGLSSSTFGVVVSVDDESINESLE